MNGKATTHINQYTTESILKSLGYADPMEAARQQARMILLGRLAHYRSAVQQLEHKWQRPLAEMRRQYEAPGQEDADLDDDYVAWQWYSEIIAQIESQLSAIANQ